jgi:hypothetical protein
MLQGAMARDRQMVNSFASRQDCGQGKKKMLLAGIFFFSSA